MAITEVNFALAPAGATHYDFYKGGLHWLKYEKVWMYFDDGEWWPCEEGLQPQNEKEIPARERELNRWADSYEYWNNVTKNEILIFGAPAITENDFYQRRAERIEAGLIDDGNKNIEPEYTHEYRHYGVSNRCTIFCDEKDANGNIVVKNAYDEFVLVQAGYIWPIKTPEQKARDSFIELFEYIESNNCTSQPLSVSIYNELTESGVDLTPLIKELNK